MSDLRQEDDRLVELCKRGDRSALDSLIRKYNQRAYKYAYRLTRSTELAGDIVAESFVRVHSSIRNFKGDAAFSTWLYRIVTNCYLDVRKKEKHRQQISIDQSFETDEGEVTRQIEDESPGPDQQAENSAREAAIQAALGRMPEYQRAMLVMFHVEGLSYEDIAAALDLPLGTVKSRLNRARLTLRDELAQHEELFQAG